MIRGLISATFLCFVNGCWGILFRLFGIIVGLIKIKIKIKMLEIKVFKRISRYISAISIGAVLMAGTFGPVVLRAEDGGDSGNLSEEKIEAGRYPYKQTMVISAYYSPLPGQDHYVTGSLEGDIRLNGSGVNGADGTPVYPGMIAAPKTYPFGFKMKIPGIGTVAVHDRGGAIKGNRLDVWMGYGDEGLKRALQFGKRSIEVEMYGVDASIKESVYLEGFQQAEVVVQKVARVTRLFPKDIWYQSEGEDVKKFQEGLKQIGYFKGEVSGFYGDETLEAVYAFQKAYGIVNSWEDLGAGHGGVNTRATLEKLLKGQSVEKKNDGSSISLNEIFFSHNLALGDKGENVMALQAELKKLNYLRRDPNGVFDEVTEHAVFKYQQRKGIVSGRGDAGAGVVGPQTRNSLNLVFSQRSNRDRLVAMKEVEAESKGKFLADLDPGASGEKVKELQIALKNLGYFEDEVVTNFFGQQTQKALIAFQIDKKIVKSAEDLGAGRLGPQTREILNSIAGSGK